MYVSIHVNCTAGAMLLERHGQSNVDRARKVGRRKLSGDGTPSRPTRPHAESKDTSSAGVEAPGKKRRSLPLSTGSRVFSDMHSYEGCF